MPTIEQKERARERFLSLYASDGEFRAEIDKLIADEVFLLRAALSRIGAHRREHFSSSFAYEVVVRREVDQALGREAGETTDEGGET